VPTNRAGQAMQQDGRSARTGAAGVAWSILAALIVVPMLPAMPADGPSVARAQSGLMPGGFISPESNPYAADRGPQEVVIDDAQGIVIRPYYCESRMTNEMVAVIGPIAGIPGGDYREIPERGMVAIRATREKHRVIRRLWRMLDTPRPQVLIEVRVIRFSYDSDQQLGFDLRHDISGKTTGNSDLFYRGFEFDFNPQEYLRALTTTAPPINANAAQVEQWRRDADDIFPMTARFRMLGEAQSRLGYLDLAVRAMQERGRATIVARPTVLVEAGYTAKIEAGQRIPIQQRLLQSDNVVTRTKYEQTGVTLTLTPYIVEKNSVQLYVAPEVRTLQEFVDLGGGLVANPIFQEAKARTVVTVDSGQTLDLGGLRSSRTVTQETGFPILMDIPLLGYLFRSTRQEKRRQDISFFITPTAITTLDRLESRFDPSAPEYRFPDRSAEGGGDRAGGDGDE
jgi:type II secretory pathway component GspD/PulD (secretin)